MAKQIAPPEAALAALVVRYFQDLGAEVYQEVALGSRADIVADFGAVLHAVEVKTSLSLAVIEQAWGWREYANLISVAVPYSTRRYGFGRTVCASFGIGVLGVETHQYEALRQSAVHELLRPRLLRRVSPHLRAQLCEEQKTYAAAGNDTGKFWSPFKATCAALREVVEAESGLTWREAIKRLKHHYASDSSATSNLHRLATLPRGPINELSWLAVSDQRPARLYTMDALPLQARQTPLDIEAAS